MTSFRDIFGQASAIDWLSRAWRNGRLPHGLVFVGPAGIGKATTAGALGALFLCQQPTDAPAACGHCPSCRVFAAGNHPDFHRVYRQLVRLEKKEAKARDISVDVIRQFLVDSANLKASLGHGKVFIVEEAELMSASAQNSLLKTLEEPQGRSLIVLLTTQLDSLLSTIRSRCQVVRFASLADDLLKRELQKRGISAADADRAAAVCEGSLGLALQWLGDGIVDRALEIGTRLDGILAGRGAGDLPEFLKASVEAYSTRQLERDEEASKDQLNREGLGLFLFLGAQHLRRQLRVKTDPNIQESLCRGIDHLQLAERYADGNVTLSLIFQQVTVTLEQCLTGK